MTVHVTNYFDRFHEILPWISESEFCIEALRKKYLKIYLWEIYLFHWNKYLFNINCIILL